MIQIVQPLVGSGTGSQWVCFSCLGESGNANLEADSEPDKSELGEVVSTGVIAGL
jgi:hypothetical protein